MAPLEIHNKGASGKIYRHCGPPRRTKSVFLLTFATIGKSKSPAGLRRVEQERSIRGGWKRWCWLLTPRLRQIHLPQWERLPLRHFVTPLPEGEARIPCRPEGRRMWKQYPRKVKRGRCLGLKQKNKTEISPCLIFCLRYNCFSSHSCSDSRSCRSRNRCCLPCNCRCHRHRSRIKREGW